MQVFTQFKNNPLIFKKPKAIISCFDPLSFEKCFHEIESALKAGFFLAGFFSYEAGYCFEEQLHENKIYDLVLTDIEMPEMNGFELTALIKQSERFHHLPVVIVTSLAKDEDRQRGIEVGAEAFIVKGQFETKILLDVVGQLI